jgi:protein-S-isoprenylcysteine O-methyltransferase Ste14
MQARRALPPTYLFVALAGMVLLHLLLPVLKLVNYPWNLLGVIPLVMGSVLNLIADAAFKKAQTTVKPFEESAALITSGVFRVCRHPMYLGMVLILLGIAILLGSLSPLLIVAIFAVLMERVFVRVEEVMLEQRFGAAWSAYKAQVRKWI